MAVKASGSVKGISFAIAQEWSDRIMHEAVTELTEGIEEIYTNARADWPQPGQAGYDSSRSRAASRYEGKKPFIPRRKEPSSRDGLMRSVEESASVITGRVWNDVSYAKFVKANSLGGRSAFVVLLRSPMRKLVRKMARNMEKRIAKELNDG